MHTFPTSSGPTSLVRCALIGVVVIIAIIFINDATYNISCVFAIKTAMQYKRLLIMQIVTMVRSCQSNSLIIIGRVKYDRKLIAL